MIKVRLIENGRTLDVISFKDNQRDEATKEFLEHALDLGMEDDEADETVKKGSYEVNDMKVSIRNSKK